MQAIAREWTTDDGECHTEDCRCEYVVHRQEWKQDREGGKRIDFRGYKWCADCGEDA